jgi:diadenosine tetraphosphate (Ap4A) HIT family hydrolase
MSADCYPCSMSEQVDALPPSECVHLEGGWRVAHAFNSTLPGWLVLLPMRHVTSMDELTAQEAEELGLLARKVSIALRAVTDCTKTYLMLFAEAEGFGHLHVHVVPRMPDFESEVLGPRVFAYLTDDDSAWIPGEKLDELALRIRAAVATVH